jgi:NAD(P)-dependent dehydrogenase (short-subunit alcohol dehydrogenase family)
MFSFKDQKAFIVGAAGDLGRCMALEYVRRGAGAVAIADLNEAGAKETAALIEKAGAKAIGLKCDVADRASLAATVKAAEEFLGAIDISTNAAGVALNGHLEDIPRSEWDRMFGINVFANADIIELVLPGMRMRGKGYIASMASVAGFHPFAYTRIPYAASKAAQISMMENLAIYLRPKGINVSVLCPGPTATGVNVKTWSKDVPVVAPGRDYKLLTPQRTATVFCDGMEAERSLILAQEGVSLGHLRRFAASPESYIMERIGLLACGDTGRPTIDHADPELAAILNRHKPAG